MSWIYLLRKTVNPSRRDRGRAIGYILTCIIMAKTFALHVTLQWVETVWSYHASLYEGWSAFSSIRCFLMPLDFCVVIFVLFYKITSETTYGLTIITSKALALSSSQSAAIAQLLWLYLSWRIHVATAFNSKPIPVQEAYITAKGKTVISIMVGLFTLPYTSRGWRSWTRVGVRARARARASHIIAVATLTSSLTSSYARGVSHSSMGR